MTERIISRREAREQGLKRYFTGKVCPSGHIVERFVSNGACVGCLRMWEETADKNARRDSQRKWYHANKKKISNRRSELYQENPEKYKSAAKRFYYQNPEKFRERSVNYGKRNPEKIRQRNADNYIANIEFNKLRSREWFYSNPEKASEQRARRRSREYAVEGNYTGTELKNLYHRQKGKCIYCFKKITLKPKQKETCHADHIYPISRGGTNDIKNIQLVCKKCNLTKHAKDPFQFALENGRLL